MTRQSRKTEDLSGPKDFSFRCNETGPRIGCLLIIIKYIYVLYPLVDVQSVSALRNCDLRMVNECVESYKWFHIRANCLQQSANRKRSDTRLHRWSPEDLWFVDLKRGFLKGIVWSRYAFPRFQVRHVPSNRLRTKIGQDERANVKLIKLTETVFQRLPNDTRSSRRESFNFPPFISRFKRIPNSRSFVKKKKIRTFFLCTLTIAITNFVLSSPKVKRSNCSSICKLAIQCVVITYTTQNTIMITNNYCNKKTSFITLLKRSRVQVVLVKRLYVCEYPIYRAS